ncbi:hypothetical protein acdb102_30850 [Acidothermaceae bacterium B102]|nr:hypothetical protein acdb102_30850 [Acidothermaceae bacterium B102]
MTRRILVVGATGALRPAAFALASSWATVVAWALHQESLDGFASAARAPVETIAVDYTDVAAVTATLAAQGTFDAALLYCPSASADVVTHFARAVRGPVVCLLTSAAAAPVRDEAFDLASVAVPQGCRRLVLGWAGDDGATRWHTPEEISAAALDVLFTGHERVLGVVRPWDRRPS